LFGEPPHIWHQVIPKPSHAPDWDVLINDYFLVRCDNFKPQGTLSREQLELESMTDFRWWSLDEISKYSGEVVLQPRTLALLGDVLLRNGVPESPIEIGWSRNEARQVRQAAAQGRQAAAQGRGAAAQQWVRLAHD